jgi:hypothetical protein
VTSSGTAIPPLALAVAVRPAGACHAATERAPAPARRGHHIEVLNVNPRLKKAIILLLYRTDVKVLKDALAHLGPYQTLTSVRYSDPYGVNTVPLPVTIQI